MAANRSSWLVGLVVLAGCGSGSANSATEVAMADPAATTTVVRAVAPSTAAVSGLPDVVATTLPTAPVTVAAPCSVVAVGDSVGVDLIDNGLSESLAAVGCELKWTGGRRGITVSGGASELSGASDITADVAVVILGYHNARSETQAGRFPSLIDTVMETAGPRLVVWPMLAATDDCSDSYKTAAGVASANLRDATARWPNLVLADYPSVLAAHPEYSQQRCPHLLADGSRAVAEWLAGEVRAAVDAAAG